MRHLLIAAALALLFAGCTKAPLTGRSQLILIDYAQEMKLGATESDKILQTAKLGTDAKLNAKIRQIGGRIAAVSGREDYQWEFHVIEEETVNAFCLPGGKVFFYTGILKVMQNDDQIAAVMGHEVAHALARHGGERMSMQMLSQIGAEVLAVALEVPSKYQGLYRQAYAIGSSVGVLLPFSRKHEHEADQIGVYLMYKAGYDPHEAVRFWEQMSRLGGKKPPEFLSTHPSDASRIEAISSFIRTLEQSDVR